jgi:2-polyprenyl-6-methoxyphenol hydroxylase-like FAD-dependent oxidoreductase
MQETITTRCVIAGGGPAGIMLGFLLARVGVDVHVLEKWPDFFRDFRGDTIHPSTMEVLDELGLLDSFLKLPHNKTRMMTANIGGEEVTAADFTRLHTRAPFVAFIPQWDFLNFIADTAKQLPAFHLHMETEAIDLIEENGRTLGIRAKNKDDTFEIRADVTIGADGRHSLVREKAHLEIEELGAPIDVLWFRLPMSEADLEQSFGFINQGKVLITLDRGDYWQCAFIINKGDFDHVKEAGIEAFRKNIAEVAPFLASSTSELKDFEQVKFLSVTVDHLRTWYKEGLLCIGDSAHAMSPIGGVGINLAIQDAVAAANVLIPAFKNGTPGIAEFQKIQKRREWPTRLTQRLQVFIQNRILIPYLRSSKGTTVVPWPFRLLKIFPFLRYFPARFVGIGFRPEHIRS